MNLVRTTPKSIRILLNLAFWGTIVVILAGSVVRTTASGLGCPDWPKCFGTWIPPTSIDELPLDYKTKFQVAGKVIADFDPYKTWIEYLNRLLGALLGLLLVVLSVTALVQKKHLSSKVFWGSHLALFLVIVQGGLGALVVATHLHGQTITLHLALAIGLAVLLARLVHYARDQSFFPNPKPSSKWYFWARLTYMLAAIQVFMGTEVRKTIDHLVHDFVSLPRSEWALHLDYSFLIHRSLSIVFVMAAYRWFFVSKQEGLFELRRPFVALAVFTILSAFTGVVMRELGFPAWAQPAHLVLATLFFVQVDHIYLAAK
jgi:heme a synthase